MKALTDCRGPRHAHVRSRLDATWVVPVALVYVTALALDEREWRHWFGSLG